MSFCPEDTSSAKTVSLVQFLSVRIEFSFVFGVSQNGVHHLALPLDKLAAGRHHIVAPGAHQTIGKERSAMRQGNGLILLSFGRKT